MVNSNGCLRGNRLQRGVNILKIGDNPKPISWKKIARLSRIHVIASLVSLMGPFFSNFHKMLN